MRKSTLILAFIGLLLSPALNLSAQTNYDKQELLPKYWIEYVIGIGLNYESIGDLNGDGYDDVAVYELMYGLIDEVTGVTVLFGSEQGLNRDSALEFKNCWLYASAGDVNGDGFPDLVLRYFTNYSSNTFLKVVYGTGYGTSNISVDTMVYTGPDQLKGLRGLGDINNDGYDDLLLYKESGFVYLGSSSGLTDSIYIEISRENCIIGSISTLGDVDGDGKSDILIQYKDTLDQKDLVVLHTIDESGFNSEGILIRSRTLGDQTVSSMSISGDLDNDGYNDIALGLSHLGNGRVYVYSGDSIEPDTNQIWEVSLGADHKTGFGGDVAIVRDVDGDDFDDLLVGAVDYFKNGAALLYKGAVTMDTNVNAFFLGANNQYPHSTNSDFGYKLGSSGDFNGDGIGDILVTDPTSTNRWILTDFGQIQFYYGSQNPYRYGDTSLTACDSYKSHTDRIFDSSAVYYDTLSNSGNGWGTRRRVELTINYTTWDTTNIMSCGYYQLNAAVRFDSSGYYTFRETNENGCLHFQTYEVEIEHNVEDTICDVACDSYTLPSGKVVTESGVYQDFVIEDGDLTLYSFNILVLHSSESFIEAESCQIYLSPKGQFLTKSGVYQDTFVNYLGCDSIVTINLTILEPTYGILNYTSCKPFTDHYGVVHLSDTSFELNWINTKGCDSVIQINYNRLKAPITVLNVEACESYTSSLGKIWTQPGVYRDTFMGSWSCDSIVEVHLTIDNLEITEHPKDLEVEKGHLAYFELNSNGVNEFQWQTDRGFGFETLSNAGQYDGVHTDSLIIYDAQLGNNRQYFRCIVQSGACEDTSESAILLVLDKSGVTELESAKIQLYPNPTDGNLTIKMLIQDHIETVSIWTIDGQLVSLHQSEFGTESQLQLSLSTGLYLVKVNLDNGQMWVKKVLVY